jgi:hypothetical protein
MNTGGDGFHGGAGKATVVGDGGNVDQQVTIRLR